MGINMTKQWKTFSVTVGLILFVLNPMHSQASYEAKVQKQINEQQEQFNKRTAQEKKLDSGIYGALVIFEDSISAGMLRVQAMSCFNGFLQDDSGRIYVVLKLPGGHFDAKLALEKAGGSILHEYQNSIYCWIKPEALRILIDVDSIERIEMFYPPVTR